MRHSSSGKEKEKETERKRKNETRIYFLRHGRTAAAGGSIEGPI
jgi:hypothetical protein